ncbi:MAG: prepilin-type N-terminal cleavage/methylation domain-containing protein [Phycisphaeraceae bacterium]|nr:prepilin-type N-terminal cleavage/methylation domain-containing protein [Phycisphaeraceae bacterium]
MRLPTEPQSAGGFTLLELLVTIVIMLLLMGLLLPVMRSARMQQQQLTCGRQLGQLGLETVLITQRRGGSFPRFLNAFPLGNSGRIKVQVEPPDSAATGLDDYSADLFVCPTDQAVGSLHVRWKDKPVPEWIPFSYACNIELALKNANANRMQRADDIAVLFDGSMGGPSHPPGKNVQQGTYADSFEFAQFVAMPRHNEKITVLFADWHATTVPELTEEMILLGGSSAANPARGRSGR